MATSKKFSELTAASTIGNNDLVAIAHEDAQAETGYVSQKATASQMGQKAVHGIEYETLLANFPSGKRNPTDAIEYVRNFLFSQLPVNTASGSIANFNTSLALPLVSGKFGLPYDVNGYTGMNIGYVDFNQLVTSTYLYIMRTTAINWTNINAFTFSLISEHKYLVMINGKTVNGGNIGLRDMTEDLVYRPQVGYSFIYSSTINSSNTTTVQGQWSEGVTNAYLNIFDLTAMFGSTIADYIYSLEQSTAGAGVALFKQIFYKDYYAYNAGGTKVSVDSVNGEPTCPNAQITFGQTIYGGEFDSVTGKLTSKYNADGTEKATPDIIQLTPLEIVTLIGTNNIWCDCNGNTEVSYKLTSQEYTDLKIAELQAIVLSQ